MKRTKYKLKAPLNSKEWAILWCDINRHKVKFLDTNFAVGAMDLCEMFCSSKERGEEWKRLNKS